MVIFHSYVSLPEVSHDYNNSGFSCHHVQKTYLKTGYTPSSLPLKYPTLIPSQSPLIAYWWLTQFVSGLQPQLQTDIAPTYPTMTGVTSHFQFLGFVAEIP